MENLRQKCVGKVCILADIDRQHILPFGSPLDVRGHVRQVIRTLGTSAGGLVSWAEIGVDVPLANVEAMLEAFHALGDDKSS